MGQFFNFRLIDKQIIDRIFKFPPCLIQPQQVGGGGTEGGSKATYSSETSFDSGTALSDSCPTPQQLSSGCHKQLTVFIAQTDDHLCCYETVPWTVRWGHNRNRPLTKRGTNFLEKQTWFLFKHFHQPSNIYPRLIIVHGLEKNHQEIKRPN